MQEDNTSIRKYIRHITGIPIEVSLDYAPVNLVESEDDTITNVSLGGLSFIATERLDINEHIKVRFPVLREDTELGGKVVWCKVFCKLRQRARVGANPFVTSTDL